MVFLCGDQRARSYGRFAPDTTAASPDTPAHPMGDAGQGGGQREVPEAERAEQELHELEKMGGSIAAAETAMITALSMEQGQGKIDATENAKALLKVLRDKATRLRTIVNAAGVAARQGALQRQLGDAGINHVSTGARGGSSGEGCDVSMGEALAKTTALIGQMAAVMHARQNLGGGGGSAEGSVGAKRT